ncbi:DUF4168 domain-containing protein [Crocosphaera chwakensis]|uniref:DUF4168 domain-containing protein n=1 Tax=Crocosphaera chwakensis CCY0110 TaxID=391612 RepID=A3IMX7_9CHRO|nr:DUF4168 domain-containing protein [Crocosphaera chwakensis]EAZ92230.1 hypothetical protein CY0110_25006 [Crocosphaera chwakensis CCY0110]
MDSTNNKMLKQLLSKGCLGVVICATGFGGFPAYSQPGEVIAQSSSEMAEQNISQQDLEKFADAIADLRAIDEETQQKMIEAVQATGMSPEEFMKIGKQEDTQMNLSADKQMQFEEALEAVRELNEEDRKKKRVAVKEAGLEISRFNEIGKIVENNRDLQKKVVEILSQ